MTFNPGDKVAVYGIEYTVLGTVKRSYAVKNTQGKTYKVTAANMKLISRSAVEVEPEVSIPTAKNASELSRMLELKKIFDKDARMPVTASECQPWFESIECQMSPENLHCDGEISRTQAMRKLASLKRAWKELEKIQGKKQQTN